MPLQNRVTPFGDIISTPERGTFMGNRGVLHNSKGHIKRSWVSKRWLICQLDFRGRYRTVMTPGRYTELFFLDEATALAAGHRPCAECRRARFNEFVRVWSRTRDNGLMAKQSATIIDDALHEERATSEGEKQTYTASLDDLPDGAFITAPSLGEEAFLVWGKFLYPWSPGGYRESRVRPKTIKVSVLTPKSTVSAIKAGFRPETHSSAQEDFGVKRG